ncbi:hypothetical protein [Lewinella sp. W8]|uniref:hypothetical protein n=1 Tax=Lewinella sp. W8 TaxID=2528208 RepID=UPI0010671F53|nr:hypothetical protein [Lewinella sp. W8]MTB49801.1 hypothetical protein [Lewinella sp. W8]
MFPAGTQTQLVKPTLERFVEDRLAELELTHDSLAEQMGDIIGTDYKIHRLTRRINSPETFPASELAAFAQVLQLKDWYADLVINFGAGIDGCSVADFDRMLHPMGCQLGRVNVAA